MVAAIAANTSAVDALKTTLINVYNTSHVDEDVADLQNNVGTMAVSVGQLVKVVEDKLSAMLIGLARLQAVTGEGLANLVDELRQLEVTPEHGDANGQLATEAADAMEM